MRHTCCICGKKRDHKFMKSFQAIKVDTFQVSTYRRWYCWNNVSKWDWTPTCQTKLPGLLSEMADKIAGVNKSVLEGQK